MRPLLLLAMLMLPLLAAESGGQAPGLSGIEWIANAPSEDALPRILFLFTPATPQAQEVAVDLGRLQRQYRGKVQVIGLSSDSVAGLQAFRRKLGVEMGYPVGHAPATLVSELATGARGLPHSLLIGPDGKIRWRGHPRALAQILPQQLD